MSPMGGVQSGPLRINFPKPGGKGLFAKSLDVRPSRARICLRCGHVAWYAENDDLDALRRWLAGDGSCRRGDHLGTF